MKLCIFQTSWQKEKNVFQIIKKAVPFSSPEAALGGAAIVRGGAGGTSVAVPKDSARTVPEDSARAVPEDTDLSGSAGMSLMDETVGKETALVFSIRVVITNDSRKRSGFSSLTTGKLGQGQRRSRVKTEHMLRRHLGQKPSACETDTSKEGEQDPPARLGARLPQEWTARVYFVGG